MRRLAGMLLLVPLVAPAQTDAPGESQWRLSGSTTLRYDHYRVSGERSGSPYVEENEQAYQDLELTLDGTTAEGKHWQFQFAGTLSDAEYRSPHQGFVPERLYMLHEDPTAPVPWRLELGDQYLNLTPLTLRKTLKAARVELQPSSDVEGRSYSVVFASGADQSDWLDLDLDRDYYHAASFLMEDEGYGRVSLNLAYNGRSADQLSGAPAQEQWVGSIGYAKEFTLGNQQLAFEGEWAHFSGDVAEHIWDEDPSRTGTGVYAQLSGQHQDRPLDYELSYQRYSEDFQPNGASVPNGVESVDAAAGWDFDNGWRLQGSLGWERNGFEGENPLTSKEFGVAVSGPVHTGAERPVQVRAQFSQTERSDELGYRDRTNRRARVDVTVPAGDNDETNIGVGITQQRDQLNPEADSTGYRLDLAHRRQLELGDLNLSVTPGVDISRDTGPRPSQTVTPGLEIEARKGGHSVAAQLSAQFQDDLEGEGDVDTYRAGLSYAYRKDQHSVGVELSYERRDPLVGEATDSSQVGVFYRYDFDKTLG